MNSEILDWLLLLGRWLHITVAITWIGTSIFFMWLDRSFIPNPENKSDAHIGEVWMVHGGGFYHVEKLLMGKTEVPGLLHWFKWESYWTWISGVFLLILTYYTGSGTYLLDPSISDISFMQAICLCIFSILGSWFFYDFVWELELTRKSPKVGHTLTLAWFILMTYILFNQLSGRAAYIHIGAMLGTWMALNVFVRIIPRQVRMVEAAKKGEPVNANWAINAKSRSTHNTYFTLPVIFIMISNHFPATYGHELGWLALLLLSAAGALIRQYFIIRLSKPSTAKICAVLGIVFIITTMALTKEPAAELGHHDHAHHHEAKAKEADPVVEEKTVMNLETKLEPTAVAAENLEKSTLIKGVVSFTGKEKPGKKLRLPGACAKQFKGPVYSDESVVTNGKLANVLIRVSQGLENQRYEDVPSKEVVLDQKGCIYVPRVIAARVNQKVTFVNSDKIFHNVKSVTKKNPKFNLAMPRKNQRITRTFSTPELFLKTKCSVHPWMQAYVAILDHPYFAVTKKDGKFTLPKMAKGTYTLEAWHEVYGSLKKEFTVTAEKELSIDFTFNN